MDAYLAKIERLTVEHGWAVQLVGPGEDEEEFGYTVGMFRLGHPEFILFALPSATAHLILNALGARVRSGEQFSAGAVLSGVVHRRHVCLIDVTDSCEHLRVANALADRAAPVPALQVVIQDADGRWPWDAGWPASVPAPLLGPVPPLAPVSPAPTTEGRPPEVSLCGFLARLAVADDSVLSCAHHPAAGSQEVLVRLLQDDDGYPGVDLEALWAEPVAVDRWRIVSVPYYAYGLSVGDTVTTATDEVGTWAVSVVGRGGHSTLRVLALSESTSTTVQAALEDAGAVCDQSSSASLFAVDIPPDTYFAAVDEYLESVEEVGVVEYEDTCVQHSGVADWPHPTLPDA